MDRFYQFAGITVRVSVPKQQMYSDDGVLAPFAAPAQRADHALEIELADTLDAPQGECLFQSSAIRIYQRGRTQIRYEGTVQDSLDGAHLRIAREGSRSIAQIKRQTDATHITPKAVLNAMEAEHLIVCHGGLLLHASYISHNGAAILFTAPSGAGKSTQAALWCSLRGAQQINGDRAAVRITAEGTVCAAGIPFSGSSGVCENVTLPLKAVVYLTQAPNTTITPLSGVTAFRRIWEGCSVNAWNREDVAACAQTIMDMLASVPVLHLACTPDASAVTALEQALEKWRYIR